MKEKAAGFAAALTLLGGGVAVTDAQVNPYTDKGEVLEIVAESTVKDSGVNEVELVKERPEVILKKWDGEAAISVRYDKVTAEGSRALLTDRMEWKGLKEEVHAYPLATSSQMEDGGFEIEVFLKERPDSNRFDFAIEGTEELDFFYQPELSQEDIDEGASRPENVVGSYAVYHKERVGYRIGNTNYATGKVFHIYRPKAYDASGNETWAILSYDAGTLTVEVPEKFLETATYPVRVDPTFGYTSIGASGQSGSLGGTAFGQTGTGVTGNLVSHHLALQTGAPNSYFTEQYVSNSTSQVSNIANANTSYSVTGTYTFYSIAMTGLLTGSTQYVTTLHNFGTNLAYDSGAGLDGGSYDGGTGLWTANTTRNYSIYFTYTDPVIPTVSTKEATLIYLEEATLNGDITDIGGAVISEHGFAYGTDSTLQTVIATSTLGAGSPGFFDELVVGLTLNTVYYFRAYAENVAGTGYGSIQSFRTGGYPETQLRSGATINIRSGGTINAR